MLLEFASIPTKQWFPIEVGNEIGMYFLLFFVSNLDFKPLFVPIEANLGSVYFVRVHTLDNNSFTQSACPSYIAASRGVIPCLSGNYKQTKKIIQLKRIQYSMHLLIPLP